MTRKRDIERRFLQKQGWVAMHTTIGWLWFEESNGFMMMHGLDRESAFKKVIKDTSPSERRYIKRIRRMANA